MKSKILTILLVSLFIFPILNLTAAKNVLCPTCNGIGITDCSLCNGTGLITQTSNTPCENCTGTGLLVPRVFMKTMTANTHDGSTYVLATFFNKEIIPIDGKITATLSGTSFTSETLTFPPNQELTQEVAIPYVSTLTGMQLLSAVKVKVTDIQEITCPYCNGDGNTPLTKTCSQCQGTGTIECTLCEATGFVTEGLVATPGQNGINFTLIAWALIAVVAVLGISFTGFVLIKKRRISEKSLRNLSNGEFQTWVLKRLDAKNSTSTDTSQGIDGYSPIDQPIQIKQSDNVGMSVIDLFTSSVARKRASSGIIVAFSFSDDAIRSKIRARRSLNIDLEMITVRELIENRKMY